MKTYLDYNDGDEVIGTDEHSIDFEEARSLGLFVEQFPVELGNSHLED